MCAFDSLGRNKPSADEVKNFYKLAYDKAFDDLLKNTIGNVPIRPGQDVYADAFTAIFSGHDRNRELATQAAREQTMKKFGLSRQDFDSIWAS